MGVTKNKSCIFFFHTAWCSYFPSARKSMSNLPRLNVRCNNISNKFLRQKKMVKTSSTQRRSGFSFYKCLQYLNTSEACHSDQSAMMRERVERYAKHMEDHVIPSRVYTKSVRYGVRHQGSATLG